MATNTKGAGRIPTPPPPSAGRSFSLPGGGTWNPETGQGTDANGRPFQTTPGASLKDVVAVSRAVNPASSVAPGGGGSATPGAAGDGGLSSEQSATAASFTAILRQYGLEELIPLAQQWARNLSTPDEMWLQLMDPSTEAGKVVDRIYPELRLRREQGLTSSIAEIRAYREQGRELLKASGLDRVVNADQFLRDRYVGNVSLNRLNERIAEIEDEVTRVATGDPEVMAELEAYQRFHGVSLTTKDLVAFALDFDKADAEIRRQRRTVQLDVLAGRAGFGDLSLSEAQRLTDSGVSDAQAQEGFGFLADSQELLGPLVGSGEDQIGRDVGLDAVFAGNANARRRIARRQRERTSAFEGGGGYASGQGGFAGIGEAS